MQEKMEYRPMVMSMGSVGHALGKCKPCAFFHKEQGCQDGEACNFCHLCKPGEKKRRQKEKFEAMRLRRERRAAKEAAVENQTHAPVALHF